ncbi:MAG: nucleotidyltransferase family protein [Acidobacteria bacterium]|nr:nucleotidyltransferase family protein [Acidobacteriota bacterium]
MREDATAADVPLTAAQDAAARAGLKGLMPVGGGAGRPFLDYVLSALVDAGIREIGLVVAPEHDAIGAQYAGERTPSRVALHYVVQREPIGTADAVGSAESFVDGRPFLVVNADNLYPVETLAAMRALDGPGLPGFERDDLVRSSGIPRERVAAFALLKVAPDRTLIDIVEKPGVAAIEAAGPHALISMNCWRFDRRIFAACRDVPRSARGEFELPEAVRLAVRRGVRFQVVPARGPVLDLSRRADVPLVAERLAAVRVRL